jgi:hypothetical protein
MLQIDLKPSLNTGEKRLKRVSSAFVGRPASAKTQAPTPVAQA